MNTRFSAKVWTVSVSHDIFLHLRFFSLPLSQRFEVGRAPLEEITLRSELRVFFFKCEITTKNVF